MLAIPGEGVAPQPNTECSLRVKLPRELSNFFSETGYVSSIVGEQRASARLRVRCEAAIESTYTPPFMKRDERRARVLVKDLSRGGIAVLFHAQMFPTERFCIELHQRRLHVMVVRCRKLGELCFEIGATIEAVEALQRFD